MLLGVAADATADEVRAAFRRRVRSLHPDQGGPGGDMDAFVVARSVLLRLVADRTPESAAYVISASTGRTGRLVDVAA